MVLGTKSLRDRVLLRVLIETGIRRAEAVMLRWTDVEFNDRYLIVRKGKGSKLRMIPIGQELAVDLQVLVPRTKGQFVLHSRQGERLSFRQVNRIIADLGRRVGIRHPDPRRRHLTCHLFRHTFARLWKDAHGSIESLSTILGHNSVATTWDVYGRESWADVQRNYRQTAAHMFKRAGKKSIQREMREV